MNTPILLPPLPIQKPTGWLPIVDKPVRSGFYDLLTIDREIERRYFDVLQGNWHCVSGKEPCVVYNHWRGVEAQW